MTVVFLDTETTSLRHDRRAWEIGLIVRDEAYIGHEQAGTEHSWFVDLDDLDLGNADLMSLKIGRFFDRHPDVIGRESSRSPRSESEAMVLPEVAAYLHDATIVGAVPWFDTDVLGQRMRAHGICPSWHYHLVDVETLAAGALKMPPPWDFDSLLAAYGLTYDEADRHTALGDARIVRDLYDAVLAGKAGA